MDAVLKRIVESGKGARCEIPDPMAYIASIRKDDTMHSAKESDATYRIGDADKWELHRRLHQKIKAPHTTHPH